VEKYAALAACLASFAAASLFLSVGREEPEDRWEAGNCWRDHGWKNLGFLWKILLTRVLELYVEDVSSEGVYFGVATLDDVFDEGDILIEVESRTGFISKKFVVVCVFVCVEVEFVMRNLFQQCLPFIIYTCSTKERFANAIIHLVSFLRLGVNCVSLTVYLDG
jgi:hypothetical protein